MAWIFLKFHQTKYKEFRNPLKMMQMAKNDVIYEQSQMFGCEGVMIVQGYHNLYLCQTPVSNSVLGFIEADLQHNLLFHIYIKKLTQKVFIFSTQIQECWKKLENNYLKAGSDGECSILFLCQFCCGRVKINHGNSCCLVALSLFGNLTWYEHSLWVSNHWAWILSLMQLLTDTEHWRSLNVGEVRMSDSRKLEECPTTLQTGQLAGRSSPPGAFLQETNQSKTQNLINILCTAVLWKIVTIQVQFQVQV